MSSPCVLENDWNLHFLPITSSNQGVIQKQVCCDHLFHLEGFLSSTSDFRVPFGNSMNQTQPNEKYEQEVTALATSGSSLSLTDDQCSEKLPSWFRNVES